MNFDSKTSLRSTFSVNGEIVNSDTRFMNITIDIMHTGRNLNNSVFEKSVVDECIDSIKNTPVLGFIKYDKMTQEKDFLGHEYILTKTNNGVEEKYVGSAFGLIPESCNPRWIMKMCSDGNEREFLQVDALLWEKFSDATGILARDSEKSQSMELSVESIEGYEDEDGLFHFEKFRFDGACILGDDVQPAMIDSNVKIKEGNFSLDEFSKTIQDELNEKFVIFSKLIKETVDQGGVGSMTNAIDTTIAEEGVEEPKTDFAQSIMQQFEDMSVIVSKYETVENYWGEQVPRYYMADIQDDEVIVVDRVDNYNYYGFAFTIDGDAPNIDFACGKRKKVRYEDYEEGASVHESAFEFGKHISEIENVAFEKVSDADSKVVDAENAKVEAETNYTQIKADFDEMKPKYDEFVAAEKQRQNEAISAEKDAKFAEYEEALAENVEFAAIKEKKDELTVDEIEKECAVLYARVNLPKASFSKQSSTVASVGVIDESDDDDKGYVNTKYGRIRIER